MSKHFIVIEMTHHHRGGRTVVFYNRLFLVHPYLLFKRNGALWSWPVLDFENITDDKKKAETETTAKQNVDLTLI
jgi:hypothetical protein